MSPSSSVLQWVPMNIAMLTIPNKLGKWRDEATGSFNLNAFTDEPILLSSSPAPDQVAALQQHQLHVAQQSATQSSPMLTAANGQTSLTSAPPSVNESEELQSSSTPTQQPESMTASTDATVGSLSSASPMPLKSSQSHHVLSLSNGYIGTVAFIWHLTIS
ncbi:hypothetical protein EI94DRAFT_1812523 [Lactarius quietus]|nr:hypothetical protein EI94DRAFT_1812523 [Lactarius quietus]